MSRCPAQLARWALRGILVCGGALAVWGLADAGADDPARAAEPARPCVLGGLLDGTDGLLGGAERILGTALVGARTPDASPAQARPAARAPAGSGRGPATSPREPATDHRQPATSPREPAADHRQPATSPRDPATGHRDPAAWREPARASALDRRPAAARVAPAPAARPVPATARGIGGIAETAARAARPVVDLAAPVVAGLSGTGLLAPVADLVRPVVEPIIEALPPALGPVLDLTRPIIDPPAVPALPPRDPVGIVPPLAGGPGAAPPPAIAGPASPLVAVRADASSPARLSPGAARAAPRAPAAAPAPGRWPGGPESTPGLMSAAPVSTAGSGPAGGGPGTLGDACRANWSPDLRPVGVAPRDADPLADRTEQPDVRPA